MPIQGFAPFPWQPDAPPQLALVRGSSASDLLVEVSRDGYANARLPAEAERMGQRLITLLHFCAGAAQVLRAHGWAPCIFKVQLHDEDPGHGCFRFDAPQEPDGGGPLIPDPYCLMTAGYAGLRAEFQQRNLPPWRERLPLALWRGSSTGLERLDLHNLPHNKRYELCRMGEAHPQLLDARFTAVVQSRDAAAHQALTHHLHQQDLLRPRIEPWDAALHRWLIEIDGNVNSWGLLWKLLSGSCVLRVASSRRQWYYHHLEPWVHLVPVAADLSDLEERLVWCRRHPEQCEAIALAGQQLAEQVVAELGASLVAACQAYGERWLAPR